MSVNYIFSLYLSFLPVKWGNWTVGQAKSRQVGTLRGHLVYLHTFRQNDWLIKTSPDEMDWFDLEILPSLSPGRNYTALLHNQL